MTQTYNGTFPAAINGTLPNQGTALEETLNLTAASDLTAFTTSYAAGGFQPNLTLYTGAGSYIASQGAQPPPGALADSTTGQTLDGWLTAQDLAPGTYILTLTDWNLSQSATATNLSDGFTSNYGDGVNFVDVAGNLRSGNYALSVDVTPAATPEPATWLMTAPLLGAAVLLRKRIFAR